MRGWRHGSWNNRALCKRCGEWIWTGRHLCRALPPPALEVERWTAEPKIEGAGCGENLIQTGSASRRRKGKRHR